MDLARRVADLIQPSLEAMGYDLVRVLMIGHQRPRLQIMAERTDDVAMTGDDCATLSRAVAAILDVEDAVTGSYTLEVSSPGIDRPLVRLADFDRFAGFDARVELGRLIDGRRRYHGRVVGTDGDMVRMAVDGTTIDIPFADIVRAKLVLTDELLAAAGAGSG
jgi:ribosome maturation factor RimP